MIPQTIWYLVRFIEWSSPDLANLRVIDRLVVPGGDPDAARRRAQIVADQVGGPAQVVEKVSGRVVETIHPSTPLLSAATGYRARPRAGRRSHRPCPKRSGTDT